MNRVVTMRTSLCPRWSITSRFAPIFVTRPPDDTEDSPADVGRGPFYCDSDGSIEQIDIRVIPLALSLAAQRVASLWYYTPTSCR